jgi:NFU1 iron-sulfur cluster scaffold homolog, mitochondrial
MFIQTQETPNPQTIKFIPGVEVLKEGTRSYDVSNDNINDSPLAGSILKVEGIKGIFLTSDFISVTKKHESDWNHLKPLVLAAIMDHYLSGMPVILTDDKRNPDDNNNTKDINESNSPESVLVEQIKELIETRVRPSVAKDGGDIIFKDFQEGVVYLELHGACSGCPSSTITLKNGIEGMLKHYVPEVKSVEAV